MNTRHNLFMRACNTLLNATAEYCCDGLDFGTIAKCFSFFTLTGIPVCDAPTIFNLPPVLSWRPKALVRFQSDTSGINALSFLLAATQTRTLAKIAGSTEREAEFWASMVSTRFFQIMAKLQEKVLRNKTSREETEAFAVAVVAVLFVSEMRSTHLLRAAKRTFDDVFLDPRKPKGRVVMAAVAIMGYFIRDLKEKGQHLLSWARYWLRRLHKESDDERFRLLVSAPIACCTVISSMELGPSFQFVGGMRPTTGSEDNDPSNKENNDGSAKGHSPNHATQNQERCVRAMGETNVRPVGIEVLPEFLATMVPKALASVNRQNLQDNLDFLTCKDLAGLLSAASLTAGETLAVRMKRDIIRENLQDFRVSDSEALRSALALHCGHGDGKGFELFCFEYLSRDVAGLEQTGTRPGAPKGRKRGSSGAGSGNTRIVNWRELVVEWRRGLRGPDQGARGEEQMAGFLSSFFLSYFSSFTFR